MGLILGTAMLLALSFACTEKAPKEEKQAKAEAAAETAKKETARTDPQKAETAGEAETKAPAAASIFRPDLLSFDQAKLKAEGQLDPAVFRRVMGKRKSSFKVCYKKALDKDPKAKGDVRVGFTISPTGRVSTVRVIESTLKNPDVEDCVVRVIRRVQFPPLESKQRVSVEYPMVFSP